VGCGSGSDERPVAAEQVSGPRTTQVGRVSCTEGATRTCTAELGAQGTVTSCFSGTQRCTDGAWGPCRGTARRPAAADQLGLVGRLALSGPALPCEDNACDPTCRNFLEAPAGGLVAAPDPSGATTRVDASLFWRGGSALDDPADSRAGVCFSAEDCTLGQTCVDVATQPACVHSKCEVGAAMAAACDPCVTQVCEIDPSCCVDGESSPEDRYWGASCVAQVESACGSSCSLSEPATAARCSSWLPGETTATCDGYDLALGVPCANTIPVCNHGNVEVPAGVQLVHFPAGSVDRSSCAPDSEGVTCTTQEPIQPGRCIAVTACSGLDEPRDVLVNPAGAGHLEECTCGNNWLEYVPGLACQEAPSCYGARLGRTPSAERVHAFFAVEASTRVVTPCTLSWAQVTSGLGGLFSSPDADGVHVAMELFPRAASGADNDGCFSDGDCALAVTECATPAVPSGALTAEPVCEDAQEAALVAALSGTWPSGTAPVAPVLEGALTTMRDAALENPSDTFAVVLVGTGVSDVCVTDTSYLVALADYFRRTWGILTYTVAVYGADEAAMAAIAEAGGTGTSRHFSGWDASVDGRNLLADLVAASGAVPSCTTELGNAEQTDPARAVVRYVHGDGSSSALTPVSDPSACTAAGGGWYYDDASTPTSLTLCPATCSLVQGDAGAEVRVELPCLGDPAPLLQRTTVSEVYVADCEEGTLVQWGFLGYSAQTPFDSSIVLAARTADRREDLPAAPMKWLTSIAAASGNQECEIADGCYVDLFRRLGRLADTRRPVLELQVELSPSTRNETPALLDWQITFSCVASE
jgi:hypothetical protein